MELDTLLKKDEFKKVVSEIVREQMSHTYQDMDEIRRSPAGSIIRIEEEIKALKQQTSAIEHKLVTIEQKMATKDEIKALEGKITLITGLIFVMLTLYGALVVKLIFFP